MTESLGTRIRQVREELGMTKKQLAALCHYTENAVIHFEYDRVRQPTKIHSIAVALNVNPAWLAFGDEWATRERVVVVENTNKKSQSARKVAHV